MFLKIIFLLIAYCTSGYTISNQNEFPENFVFGAATSSYQIEGAWNTDGKGESIWDRLTHTQAELIVDRSNGDVAADSYNLYMKDIEALNYLGVHFYRFSISWPRILPTGEISSLNENGLRYYSNLINKLIDNGIEPMVTIYHWDLPQALQVLGGFANQIIVEYYEIFVRVLFDRFQGRVKYWITFNEPIAQCVGGYDYGLFAPATYAQGVGEYLCAHNVLLAHAKAYHIYQDEYKHRYGGFVGITLLSSWFFPKTYSKEDLDAQDRALQFMLGWFAHPIYSKEGGYPKIMVETINRNSRNEGRTWSRLPEMNDDTIAYIQGTADFFGLNHYTSYMVTNAITSNISSPSWTADQNMRSYVNASWKSPFPDITTYKVPEGMRKLYQWIKKEYDNPNIFITENGYPDHGGIQDINRVNYIIEYLSQTLKAINIDKCNIKGYAVWSLIDNFEWLKGYTECYGLFDVNFNSTLKTRSPKLSASIYKDILLTRKIPKLLNKKQCRNPKPKDTLLSVDEFKAACYSFL